MVVIGYFHMKTTKINILYSNLRIFLWIIDISKDKAHNTQEQAFEKHPCVFWIIKL